MKALASIGAMANGMPTLMVPTSITMKWVRLCTIQAKIMVLRTPTMVDMAKTNTPKICLVSKLLMQHKIECLVAHLLLQKEADHPLVVGHLP